jgi:hypothetical protein
MSSPVGTANRAVTLHRTRLSKRRETIAEQEGPQTCG